MYRHGTCVFACTLDWAHNSYMVTSYHHPAVCLPTLHVRGNIHSQVFLHIGTVCSDLLWKLVELWRETPSIVLLCGTGGAWGAASSTVFLQAMGGGGHLETTPLCMCTG